MNASRADAVVGGWPLLFLVAGAYDVVLGLAFMAAGESILETVGMTLPPHVAYIHLAALFILVQGISYLFVARDPWRNVGLARVGVLYKAAYTGLDVRAGAFTQLSKYVLDFAPHAVAAAGVLPLPAGLRLAPRVEHKRRQRSTGRTAYTLADLRVSRRVGYLDQFAEGTNLLNATSEEVVGVAMPGRAAMVGLVVGRRQ